MEYIVTMRVVRTTSFWKCGDVEMKLWIFLPTSMFLWCPHNCSKREMSCSGLELEEETTSLRFD